MEDFNGDSSGQQLWLSKTSGCQRTGCCLSPQHLDASFSRALGETLEVVAQAGGQPLFSSQHLCDAAVLPCLCWQIQVASEEPGQQGNLSPALTYGQERGTSCIQSGVKVQFRQ